MEAKDLADRIAGGDVRAASRLMRWLDDGDPRARPVHALLHPGTGRGRRIGVTGPAGVGKSTLIDGLVAGWRARGLRVGVVAVDPSSPFTGGALLGDRVRMGRHAGDAGVFIRSLASRGRIGGISASAALVASVMDAMGFQRIVLETLGVGQVEIDVLRHVEATVVVTAPDCGDDVQAQKAGLSEIADLMVVNKADLPGADAAVATIEAALATGRGDTAPPCVLKTSARDGQDVEPVLDAIEDLLARPSNPGRPEGSSRGRTEALLADLVVRETADRLRFRLGNDEVARALVDDVEAHRTDPLAAARALMERLLS